MNKGHALITLLVFMATAIIVSTAAVAIILINAQATTAHTLGESALAVAEAGADNAVLRLLRDPSYTGETLTVGTGTAVITVTGTTTRTIVSEGSLLGMERRVQVVGSYSNTNFTISSWQEID